jgi:hypothetical protein
MTKSPATDRAIFSVGARSDARSGSLHLWQCGFVLLPFASHRGERWPGGWHTKPRNTLAVRGIG